MAYGNIFHAIGLHMHQPPGNLQLLINANEDEARQIIHCYDRITRYAHQCADVAKLHIGFSGTLLEQLRKPDVIDRYRHHMDIPAMLESYRQAKNIEFVDMGYYHPVFPLIPPEDWEEQLLKGRQAIEEAFGKAPRGFCPPEMAFTMEMIPALVKAGYEYVIIDNSCVRPYGEQLDSYQPYRACYEDACITIIPREQELSHAQTVGLEVYWFANEMAHRVQNSPRPEAPRLLTTWSDSENSPWFRNPDESAGFFGQFFTVYMDHVRSARYPVRPLFISEFIQQHPAEIATHVETGAWQVSTTVGYEVPQWGGSDAQRQAVNRVRDLSHRYRQLKQHPGAVQSTLNEVRHLILESESSCFLFWGNEWFQRLFDRLNPIENLLTQAEQALKSTSEKTSAVKPVVAETPKVTPEPVQKPVEKPKSVRPTENKPPEVAKPVVSADKVKEVETAAAGKSTPPADKPAPDKKEEPAKSSAKEASGPAKPKAESVEKEPPPKTPAPKVETSVSERSKDEPVKGAGQTKPVSTEDFSKAKAVPSPQKPLEESIKRASSEKTNSEKTKAGTPSIDPTRNRSR